MRLIYPNKPFRLFDWFALLKLKRIITSFIFSCLLPLDALALTNVPPSEVDITTKRIKASQFLHQATFGATMEEIDALANHMVQVGENRAMQLWITEQFNHPEVSKLEPLARQMVQNDGHEITTDYLTDPDLNHPVGIYKQFAWWDRALQAPDQLRLRTAWALSQIFVVSQQGVLAQAREGRWLGLPNYYDMFLERGFGNYRNIMQAVTLHPVMATYLTYAINAKSELDPNTGEPITFPDENYAREVLQLFSVGLHELNTDGTLKLDSNGEPIPTYDNETIRNFARVFTGLNYKNSANAFGFHGFNFIDTLVPFDDYHDTDEKTLLNGQVLPAGQGTIADITAALDNIFAHDNVGPFVAKALIQRFTSSNPSPEYINWVASKFNDNGNGQKGDMRATIRAVLMHQEARDSLDIQAIQKPNGNYVFQVKSKDPAHGKAREPLLLLSAMHRAFDAQPANPDGHFRILPGNAQVNQGAFKSPSVFNFYSPVHQPAGVLADNNLAAPEFELYIPSMINSYSNHVADVLRTGQVLMLEQGTLDLSEEEAVAHNPALLLERLSLLLTYGTVSNGLFFNLHQQLNQAPQADRVRLALSFVLASPDFIVME